MVNKNFQKLVNAIVEGTVKQLSESGLPPNVLALYQMAQKSKNPEKAIQLINQYLELVNIPVPKGISPAPAAQQNANQQQQNNQIKPNPQQQGVKP